MESDLKRIARLEYLKLRQCKQTEKTEAVKVRFWTIEKYEMKQLSRHVNFEDPFEVCMSRELLITIKKYGWLLS